MPEMGKELELPGFMNGLECARLCHALNVEVDAPWGVRAYAVVRIELMLRPWFPVGGNPFAAVSETKGNPARVEDLLYKSFREIADALKDVTTYRTLDMRADAHPNLVTAQMRLTLAFDGGVPR